MGGICVSLALMQLTVLSEVEHPDGKGGASMGGTGIGKWAGILKAPSSSSLSYCTSPSSAPVLGTGSFSLRRPLCLWRFFLPFLFLFFSPFLWPSLSLICITSVGSSSSFSIWVRADGRTLVLSRSLGSGESPDNSLMSSSEIMLESKEEAGQGHEKKTQNNTKESDKKLKLVSTVSHIQ